MSFHDVSAFAQSWGLVLLVSIFVGGCAYAFWPGNKARFERAAMLPLEEE